MEISRALVFYSILFTILFSISIYCLAEIKFDKQEEVNPIINNYKKIIDSDYRMFFQQDFQKSKQLTKSIVLNQRAINKKFDTIQKVSNKLLKEKVNTVKF